MARRRVTATLPAALELFPRLVVAILLWAGALVLWDVFHFSITHAMESVQRDGRAAFRGFGRFIGGLFFAFCAIVIIADTLPDSELVHFSMYGIATFLAAAVVDVLIGDEVRTLMHLR